MNPYKNTKIFNHTDRLVVLKQGGNPAPVHINFILSDVCNHNCSFCAYRMEGYPSNQMFDPKRMMPPVKAMQLLDDFEVMGVKAVQFTGGGEPTVHPKFRMVLEHAQKLGLDTAVVTNGQNLDKIADVLMKCVWVRISLDAGRPTTHSRVRRISDRTFGKILANIHNLSQQRDAEKSELYIGVGFVVTKQNWSEIVEATKLVYNRGADSIRFSTLFSPDDFEYYDGLVPHIKREIGVAKESETDKFEVIDCFDERLTDLSLGSPDYTYCAQQRVSTYVGADLNVYRCCVTAYNTQGLLGSVKDRSMIDLWWRDLVVRDRLENFDASTCVRCQFNEKNRTSNNILESISLNHVNFV